MPRLKEIEEIRRRLETEIQPLQMEDISHRIGKPVRIGDEPRKRKLLRRLAGPMAALRQSQARRQAGFELSFQADVMTVGERFANDTAVQALLALLGPIAETRVLVLGCYAGGEDVQFWLRQGVASLDGVDVYNLTAIWNSVIPKLADRWSRPVHFRQGSAEQLPYPDASFDLIVSDAVMEHVRNLRAATAEMARVLRPGGLALHIFGPLYYTFGGDHCIAAHGEDHGYDHLLADEADYRAMVADRALFARVAADENLGFWAENEQFSFARPKAYMDTFAERFETVFTLLKISDQGLAFRRRRPKAWEGLRAVGLTDEDLLVKAIACILRKPL